MLPFSRFLRHLPIVAAAGLLPFLSFAQSVGIGTTTPDPAAALDITAAGRGLLIPRLDSAARVSIAGPPTGLLVFQVGTASPRTRTGFYYYGGGSWLYLPDKTSSGDNLGNHKATRNLDLQNNALVGTGASIGTTVGVGVTAQGGLNLGQNTPGNSVLLGYQAGQAATGNGNTLVGYQSGMMNTTGYFNTFSGYLSGLSNTEGAGNTFTGMASGSFNTMGSYNVFTGGVSGQNNGAGTSNTYAGYASGFAATGSYNTFNGNYSGSRATGNYNTFSGNYSGFYNTTGSGNVFVGDHSGQANTTSNSNTFSGSYSGSSSTGEANTFTGDHSGSTTTTGSGNVFVGAGSGAANTTGSNNVALGYNAGPGMSGLSNTIALGNGVQPTQSNTLLLGGTGPNAVRVGIGTASPDPASALEVNGSIRQTSYSKQMSVISNGAGFFVWNHNLGFEPVILGALDQSGGGTFADYVSWSYSNNGNSSTTFYFTNRYSAGTAFFNFRWIRVN